MRRSPFFRFFLYVLVAAVVIVGGYYLTTGSFKLPVNGAREPDHDQHPAQAEFPPPPMTGFESTVPAASLEPNPNDLPMPRPEAETHTVAAKAAALPHGKIAPPIEGMTAKDLRDMFEDARTGHAHHAIDIMEPRGTPVHAVVDGNIVKLFTSQFGGLTVYQFDNDAKNCYYYAHLDHYAAGIKEGMRLQAGTVLGYVGSTGNADASAPHLHFAIFEVGPDKHWWQGTPLNPYPLLLKSVQ